MEEIALRRNMEDAERKKMEIIEKAKRDIENLERDLEREREDGEMQMMAIRHKRIETELESENESGRSIQSGASRHSGQSVSQSVGKSLVADSISGSEKRTKAWVDASVIDSSLSPRHVTSPNPSRASSHHSLVPSGAASNIDDREFTAVVTKKKKGVRNSSSTMLKTAAKTAAKTAPKETPKGTPSSKVAASKATPNPKRTPPAAPKPSGKTTQIVTSPAPSYTIPFVDPSPIDVVPEVTPAAAKDAENAASTLINLQSQQFAFQYAVSLRPKSPFNGISKDTDFEHYLKEFENVLSTPGLSAKLRLGEFRFWFVDLSGVKIAHFLLRKDEEKAIVEAISLLKQEYGKKRTTADEMLKTLMAGGKILQKDVVAVDSFVSNLGAAYYIALDTDRAEEFERKSLFDSILENKLPQFKRDWIKKWSKNEVNNGPKILFADFLSYLTMAVRIAKNTEVSETATKDPKTASIDRCNAGL